MFIQLVEIYEEKVFESSLKGDQKQTSQQGKK
jgi:hypothetical protein